MGGSQSTPIVQQNNDAEFEYSHSIDFDGKTALQCLGLLLIIVAFVLLAYHWRKYMAARKMSGQQRAAQRLNIELPRIPGTSTCHQSLRPLGSCQRTSCASCHPVWLAVSRRQGAPVDLKTRMQEAPEMCRNTSSPGPVTAQPLGPSPLNTMCLPSGETIQLPPPPSFPTPDGSPLMARAELTPRPRDTVINMWHGTLKWKGR